MVKSFESELTFEKRLEESKRINTKFPNLIPVICERLHSSRNVPELDRRKFLVPPHLTMGQFVYVVRRRIELEPSQAIFMYLSGSTMVPTSHQMSQVFDTHRKKDGFLYITYSGENTFG